MTSLPIALYELALRHPELLRVLGEAAANALRAKNPWKAATLVMLRRAAPHLAGGLANQLIILLSRGK